MTSWHQTFASAYLEGLKELLHAGAKVDGIRDRHSIGSNFGDENRPTVELLSYAFTVADPYACLLDGGSRKPREAYLAGQWLWVMSGSDDAEHISFYNPRGYEFADEGRLGGAFGARMRRNGGDQLKRAIERLRRDPSSRRAVITIAEPTDGRIPSRDFPCAFALQLLIRKGKLEAITNMRSQSALMVLPYDAALMMMVQLWAAGELGLDAGRHHWTANSFHIYEDEVTAAEAVLSDPPTSRRLPPAGGGGEDLLRSLFSYESDLRLAVITERRHSDEVKLPPALDRDDELLGWIATALRRHAKRREESVSKLEDPAAR